MRSTQPISLDSPDQRAIMAIVKEIDHILPAESGEDIWHHRNRWEKALGCVPPDELPSVLTRLKAVIRDYKDDNNQLRAQAASLCEQVEQNIKAHVERELSDRGVREFMGSRAGRKSKSPSKRSPRPGPKSQGSSPRGGERCSGAASHKVYPDNGHE